MFPVRADVNRDGRGEDRVGLTRIQASLHVTRHRAESWGGAVLACVVGGVLVVALAAAWRAGVL